MEKPCFILLFLLVIYFLSSYVWYLHRDVLISIDIKHMNIQGWPSLQKHFRTKSDPFFEKLSYQDVIDKKETKADKEPILSHTTSEDHNRILCWIMTTPSNHRLKAEQVKRTWGKRCDILLFMSSSDDPQLPTIKLNLIKDHRMRLWQKSKEAFRYVYEHYRDKADWFLKVDKYLSIHSLTQYTYMHNALVHSKK